MVASYWYAANSFSLQCRAQQQWNVKLLLAVHCSGVVRRGLLLRDELGRPQWAAISNNLPSLGSTPPQSQLQCIALHINYPTTPTIHYPLPTAVQYTYCSALQQWLGWVWSVGHLCEATWRARGGGGGADITHNELEEEQNKSWPTNQPKFHIFRQTGRLGTQVNSIIWFIFAWVLLKWVIYMNCVELRRGSKKMYFLAVFYY